MSTKTTHFKQSTQERRYRRFSDSFKIKIVRELERKKTRVSEVCKAYEVTDTAVYKWIDKFGSKKKPSRTIVESKSDTSKILALQKRIAELERALGQKQLELEFNQKLIEFAEKKFDIDIKKKSKKS
jgi:transposase-like protein